MEEKLLTLFNNTNRDASNECIISHFKDSWNGSQETTLKILYNIRDIRNGKGEKKITFVIMAFIKEQNKPIYDIILKDLLQYGCYKDLLQIIDITKTNDVEASIFSEQLCQDLENINQLQNLQNPQNISISLCSKWAPSEGSKYDKISKAIMKNLSLKPKEYRQLLTKLRFQLNLVETNMSCRTFDKIIFGQVPSSCHKLHKKAFNRVLNAQNSDKYSDLRKVLVNRYTEYKSNLVRGLEKINFKGIQPHTIIKELMSSDVADNVILEEQWSAIRKDIKNTILKNGQKNPFARSLAISDVSGSMSGEPITVSIALGILVAELSEGPFNNKLITFSEKPKLHDLSHFNKLVDKLRFVKNMEWGMNTDIIAVFKLLLDIALQNQLKSNEMIERIFIFTDMQMDNAIGKDHQSINTTYRGKSTFDSEIRTLYESHGYKLPVIVCWNLRTSGVLPIQHDIPGMIMLSGFSAELLKAVMEDKFTTVDIMYSVLDKYIIPIHVKEAISDIFF